jgi:hypothetical protein
MGEHRAGEQMQRARRIIRVLIALVAMAGLLAVIPASADASLSVKRGRLAIKRAVLDFRYGYTSGSGLFFCGQHGANRVTCDILFTDDEGDAWCGNGAARRVGGRIRVHLDLSMEGCESF